MGELALCCVTPHPPIMVPEVGRGETVRVADSTRAMEELADEIEGIGPEVLVIMSPHTPIYPDAFTVKTAPLLSGSFAAFGAPGVSVQSKPRMELVDALIQAAAERRVPLRKAGGRGGRGDGELDHGILVPLYFLSRRAYPLVCLSMSMLGFRDHFVLGEAIREAVKNVPGKAVFVASGDMSHRLKPGAPAGYSPRGQEFDRQMVSTINSADWGGLFRLDPALVDDAGECGLRSVVTLAGAVDGCRVESEVLSYEGPFGVGYLVARVRPLERDPKRRLGA